MRPEVEGLFHRLADVSPEEQAAALAASPAGAATIEEVGELLACDGGQDGTLTTPIAEAAARTVHTGNAVGTRCGPFQLVSVIGRGGMGVVYYGERVDGELRQWAAIKLLHPGWTEMHRDRFLHERAILGALSHPNIAHLLDAGHLPDGQPYLTMEYVEGRRLDAYCEGLPVRRKIELFLKICAAVEYLHRNRLVHRDLKPGNILVTAEGEPKLLDFGISKLMEPQGDVTATSMRMLTPDYASPEQMAGGPVGGGSDIYSLGVILRELAAGERNADLVAIAATATRFEPEERYASVEAMAQDLRAVLETRPIGVRRRDWIYRARKLALRRCFGIGVGITAIVTAAGVWQYARPVQRAAVSAQRLTANTSELPVMGAAISGDGKRIAYSDSLGIHVRDTASGASRVLPDTAGYVVSHWMPDGGSVVTTLSTEAGVETFAVAADGGARRAQSEAWVYSADGKWRAVSPRGVQWIVVEKADGSNSRKIWEPTPGRTLNDFAWNPDSKEIAVLSSVGSVSKVEVLDVAPGRRSVAIPESRKLWIGGVVWAQADRLVFSSMERAGANSYNSNLWEARLNGRRELASDGLRQLTRWTDFPIRPGSLTTDGKRLLMVRDFAQRDVYLAGMDAARRRMGPPRRLTLELGDDYPTAWTSDSRSVILASDRAGDMKIYRQDTDSPNAQALVDSPGQQILPRTSPDGRSVLFCSGRITDVGCRLMRAPIEGGRPELVEAIPKIRNFRCSPSGRCVVAQTNGANTGNVVSELDPVKGKGREIYRDTDNMAGTPDLSPDGKVLATASSAKITLRSFDTGRVLREIAVRGVRQLLSLDFAPDGRGFYSGEVRSGEARQLYVDLAGKATVLWRQPGKGLIWGVPSPNGRQLALLMYTTDANVYMVEGI